MPDTCQVSKTSKVTITEIPARLFRVNPWGRRVEVNGVRYAASYEEPSAAIYIVAKGDTEVEARNNLAALLASSAAAGLI